MQNSHFGAGRTPYVRNAQSDAIGMVEHNHLTAGGSGKVQIQFGGQWADAEADREWLLVAGVKVDGASVPNADFAKTMVNNEKPKAV